MATVLLIIGIIITLFFLILLTSDTIAGVIGVAVGIALIVFSRKLKKPKAEKLPKAVDSKVRENVEKYADSKYIGYCFIAGMYHHKPAIKAVLDDGSYEGPCDLIPEPENQFDPNAIRIEINGELVGYVPAKMCDVVREKLPQVANCYAEIEMDDTSDLSGKVSMYGR